MQYHSSVINCYFYRFSCN